MPGPGSVRPQPRWGGAFSGVRRGAEVVGFEDFVAHQGEQGAKDAGRWRLEGKDYVVGDGDVIHFRFNV